MEANFPRIVARRGTKEKVGASPRWESPADDAGNSENSIV